MNIGKGKLLKINKPLICRLNEICFGMHGHLSALLKDLQYFFYFKKRRRNDISEVYLQCVFCHLKHIITLNNLIEKLGGYCEILAYKNNQFDYYKLNEKRRINENVAILDSIANQTLLLKSYANVETLFGDERVKDTISQQVIDVKNVIEILRANLTNKRAKLRIN